MHSQFRFSQIIVQGNTTTDIETIKSISGLKQNISLSPSDLNSALKKLYSSNLFEEVEVTPKGKTIIIKVKENKKIKSQLADSISIKEALENANKKIEN